MLTKLVAAGLVAGLAALAAESKPTFNRDVLPILQKNCQACHRPGQVAPMAFLTYEKTRPWAKAMKVAVATRKMPPWFADPQHGPYLNDRSLSQADIDTIGKWTDSGAAEGDAKDAPPAVQWPEGWAFSPMSLWKDQPPTFRQSQEQRRRMDHSGDADRFHQGHLGILGTDQTGTR